MQLGAIWFFLWQQETCRGRACGSSRLREPRYDGIEGALTFASGISLVEQVSKPERAVVSTAMPPCQLPMTVSSLRHVYLISAAGRTQCEWRECGVNCEDQLSYFIQ